MPVSYSGDLRRRVIDAYEFITHRTLLVETQVISPFL